MGKILSIRVMAQTYDEDDVSKAWPGLCGMVWPEWSLRQGVKQRGGSVDSWPSIEAGSIEKSLGLRTHGVVELVTALGDYVRYANFSKITAEGHPFASAWRGFLSAVENAVSVNKALSKALADWKVKEATEATNVLEDALDKAEKCIPPAS